MNFTFQQQNANVQRLVVKQELKEEDKHIKVTRIFTTKPVSVKASPFNISRPSSSYDHIASIWTELLMECLATPALDSVKIRHKAITPNMRSVLIDWLQSLHNHFNLKEQTLFICVNIIDRILISSPLHLQVSKDQLQLLGITALFIASKYEDVYFPDASLLSEATMKAFTVKDIIAYELKVLTALDYQLTVPTPSEMFSLISLKFSMSQLEFFFGIFMLELFQLDVNYARYNSFVLSVSIAYLTMKNYRKVDIAGMGMTAKDIVNLCFMGNDIETEDDEEEIDECTRDIIAWVKDLGTLPYRGVLMKFLNEKYMKISELYLQKS